LIGLISWISANQAQDDVTISPPLRGRLGGWGILRSLIGWISLISWISANQAQDDVTISPPLAGGG